MKNIANTEDSLELNRQTCRLGSIDVDPEEVQSLWLHHANHRIVLRRYVSLLVAVNIVNVLPLAQYSALCHHWKHRFIGIDRGDVASEGNESNLSFKQDANWFPRSPQSIAENDFLVISSTFWRLFDCFSRYHNASHDRWHDLICIFDENTRNVY
jgi:hypothetical protein